MRAYFESFNKLTFDVIFIFLILTLLLGIKIDELYAYNQGLERDLQTAEVYSTVYSEEMEDLREENFVLYDQLRQIDANREAQEAFNNGNEGNKD